MMHKDIRFENKKYKSVRTLCLFLIAVVFFMNTNFVSEYKFCEMKAEAAYDMNYNIVFKARYYANHYPDLYETFGYNHAALLNHFIEHGMEEGRQANPEFNVQAYRERYADLNEEFGDDLKAYYMHYINYGKKEGRNAYPEGYEVPVKEEKPRRFVSDGEVKGFYDRAVFVGDSLMEGYRNYALSASSSWSYSSDFLAVRSYSLVHALKPVEKDALQPAYQGVKRNIWDAIPLMDVDRVFLMFGTNDLVGRNPDVIFKDYMKLVAKIRELSPDVEIHIISMTPTYKGANKGVLNRDGVKALNQYLQDGQNEYNYSYVDVYSQLADENGYLPSNLCSDKLIHQTRSAYAEGWETALFEHAVECLQTN